MNLPDILISEFIYELEGLAPRSYSMTKKVINSIDDIHNIKKIANIGCDHGYQSVELYEFTKARIISIDHRKEYINNFKKELNLQKLDKYIHPIHYPLDQIHLKSNELDLIWSELLPSSISYKEALIDWSQFIRENGYIVLCAYCWNTSYIPEEVAAFFQNNNMEIDYLYNRINDMFDSDLVPVSHHIMPDSCWWNYFCPIDIELERLSEKYQTNNEVLNFIKGIDLEINLFEKYGEYYSYVFFIGKKTHNYNKKF